MKIKAQSVTRIEGQNMMRIGLNVGPRIGAQGYDYGYPFPYFFLSFLSS